MHTIIKAMLQPKLRKRWLLPFLQSLSTLAIAILLSSGGIVLAGSDRPNITTTQHHKQSSASKPIDWNDSAIDWLSYTDGLKAAETAGKPILMVFYADWCPQSRKYGEVFRDRRVIEQTKKFVMVRVNTDKNPEINKQYLPDGKYVPRTIFFSSTGKPDYNIHAPISQYKYFLDNQSPKELLSLMAKALQQLS